MAGAEQREQRGSARPGPIFRPVPLDDLLRVVAARRGIDLGAYRGSMVERRTQQRMILSGVHSYAEYRQRLLADPGEVERLIEHLAIQVSGFFRDPDVWELLREVALADRGRCDPGTPMRVWSAGCGNGEEAYSLAMLLEELALDLRRPHSGVYGTDVERQCLQFARAGRYAEAALQEVAPENRPRYFMEERGATGEAYRVRPNLYARVQFLRHDLTTATAPPAGRQFELICCRNVLIYFQREAAERVQHLLWSSLVPGGYLCLGRSEWLAPALFPAFDIVDRKARLFRRKTSAPSGGRP